MKKITLILFMLLSCTAYSSTDYIDIQGEEILPSHFEQLIKKSLKDNQELKELYYDLLLENDCHISREGLVVNCSIPVGVSFANVVRLSYLKGAMSVGEYRVHLYIYHQGTQMWNSIALSLDFSLEEQAKGNYRLSLKAFKKGF